jgi:hypothetical protein
VLTEAHDPCNGQIAGARHAVRIDRADLVEPQAARRKAALGPLEAGGRPLTAGGVGSRWKGNYSIHRWIPRAAARRVLL